MVFTASFSTTKSFCNEICPMAAVVPDRDLASRTLEVTRMRAQKGHMHALLSENTFSIVLSINGLESENMEKHHLVWRKPLFGACNR